MFVVAVVMARSFPAPWPLGRSLFHGESRKLGIFSGLLGKMRDADVDVLITNDHAEDLVANLGRRTEKRGLHLVVLHAISSQ
jgi:hypothetical protein